MKKLFIFDFDGTLFDSVDDVVACLDSALKSNGFPVLTKQEYIDRLGGNIDQTMSLILKDKNTPENIGIVKESYEKCYAKSEKRNTKPYDGIGDVLKSLCKKGIMIAINSNRKTDSIRHFTDAFFSEVDFVLIEGHNEDYPSKPSPIGVEKIFEKAGVSPDEAVYIGDTRTDINTAKNAGLDCIIVRWGYGNENDWNDNYPLKTIDKVSDLYDLQI